MEPFDLKRDGIRSVHLESPSFGAGDEGTALVGVTVCFADVGGVVVRSQRLDFSGLNPPRTWTFMQSVITGVNLQLDDLYGN